MLGVYVFSDGDVATEVFKAVAAFIGGEGFASAMGIGVVFSVLGATWQYLKSHDLLVFAKWLGIYVAVMGALIGVRVPIQVIDVSNPMSAAGAVDNVPYGIAMPAHLISTLSLGLTQGIEDVFHTPDDFDYTHTGMIYGAKLFYAANQNTHVLDAKVRQVVNAFISRCIVPDILINHKYTVSQLANSSNLLGFLSQQPMSPVRGLYIDQQFQTCKQALPWLKKQLDAQLAQQTNWLSEVLFGKSNPTTQSHLLTSLGTTYQYFMGMANDAKQALIQNTMINAMRSGIGTQLATSNAPAAMINYNTTAAMQKQILSDFTLAHFASYMMPLMGTTLFLILVCCFPLVMMLALQPAMSLTILKKYVASMCFVYTWPMMFTVVNFLMTTKLSANMSGLAIAQGGITLSNQNALVHEATQYAAYCGYLMLLTPLLAVGLFKGFDGVFMNAAQSLFGTIQSWSTQGAGQLAEGNLSLGNVSMGNHSWNNWSANKHDTNYSNLHGMHTEQLANGAMVTQTASGQAIINTQSAMSQLATSLHGTDRVVSALNQSAAHSMQSGQQHRTNEEHSVSAALNQFDHLNQVWSHDLRSGSGQSNTLTDSQAQDFRHMEDQLQQYNKHNFHGHSISLSEAVKFGINGSVTRKRFGPIYRPGLTGAASINSSHNQSYNTSMQDFMNSSEGKSFVKSLNHVISSSQSLHTDHSDSHGVNETQQLATNLAHAQSEAQQASADFSQAQSYQQAASYAKEHSQSIDQNFAHAFTDWVGERYGASGQETLAQTDQASLIKQEGMAQSYWQSQRGQNQLAQQAQKALRAVGEHQLAEDYQGYSHSLQQGSPSSVYNQNQHFIETQADQQGITDSLKNKLDHQEDQLSGHDWKTQERKPFDSLKGNEEQIMNNKTAVEERNAHLKEQVALPKELDNKKVDWHASAMDYFIGKNEDTDH